MAINFTMANTKLSKKVQEIIGNGSDLPAMPKIGAEGTPLATNLNIDINILIEELNINTTNLRESATAIKAEVTKAMIGAVNDFQLMAVK
jgi:hypothetical protein